MAELAANPAHKPGRKKASANSNGKPPEKPEGKRRGRGLFSILMTWIAALCFIGVLGGAAVVAGALLYFGSDLPDYKALADYEPPIVTRAYAEDGRLLAEFAAEKRVFVPISEVPQLVIDAFLSAEDKNFYAHPGIDPAGIARAMVTNFRNLGSDRRLQGASTITQQVAKNFLLTNEVSYVRKMKEAILSFRIEQTFSKDKILELYLNEIFLGYRAYGVAAASLEYFDKPLDDLALEEAAYLAALPKAPNNYHPTRHYEAAVARRNWVIDQMVENGHVTPEEAAIAKAKPLATTGRSDGQYVNYPYFAEEVRRRLLDLYGEKGLYEGGLIARTSLIPAYQKIAERALRNGLVAYDQRHGLHSGPLGQVDVKGNWQEELGGVGIPPGGDVFRPAAILSSGIQKAEIGFADGGRGVITYNKMRWAHKEGENPPAQVNSLLKPGQVWLVEPSGEKLDGQDVYWLRQVPRVQGGIIVMDPHTGRIFAIAGGFSYDMSQFNRASQAVRQPGSAFKPFVYLTALEAGFTPATLILDAPFVMDQGPGLDKWRPQNYSEDYSGPTTLRQGLEKSRNLMTVRLADYVGMEKISEVARRFGVVDDMPPYLSYALGAGETTLLRMVAGYSMFVTGGKKVTPTLIDRIQDRNGRTIYARGLPSCPGCGPLIPWQGQETPDIPDMREQIADPRHMYQVVSMLEGVVQRGTGVLLRDLGRPVAGKTGTTNDSKDTWFIGFTPDLVVGAYVGFDEPRPLGKKETGSRVAVPIVREFMQEALKDKPAVPFRVPPGIKLVQIDADTGTRATPQSERTILEAFLEGTEPGDEAMMFTGKGVSKISDVTHVGEGASTGLGGLY